MAENKTKATTASVTAYLDAIKDEERRRDCRELSRLMARVSRQKSKMWGPSIVGFGSYHYKYESGHEGDCCIVGYSSRKPAISVYLMGDFPGRKELLARLGKHKMAKVCLYIRRLSDVDAKVLEKLVAGSIKAVKGRYGVQGSGK